MVMPRRRTSLKRTSRTRKPGPGRSQGPHWQAQAQCRVFRGLDSGLFAYLEHIPPGPLGSRPGRPELLSGSPPRESSTFCQCDQSFLWGLVPFSRAGGPFSGGFSPGRPRRKASHLQIATALHNPSLKSTGKRCITQTLSSLDSLSLRASVTGSSPNTFTPS
jgi:hypothetical protein